MVFNVRAGFPLAGMTDRSFIAATNYEAINNLKCNYLPLAIFPDFNFLCRWEIPSRRSIAVFFC